MKTKAQPKKSKSAKKKSARKTGSRKNTAGNALTIHILSDATGNLASHMVNAMLTQFPSTTFHKIYYNFLTSPEEVESTIRALPKRRKQVVVHALTTPESKNTLSAACAAKNIPHFDLTGSLATFISHHTAQMPLNEQSRLHAISNGYFERIQAMEFTAQHDDSRRLETIHDAEIVIIGVSRVSKSPTSTYLGSMGWKVANVSISPETGFPPELDRVADKIVALTLRPRDLHAIRTKRFTRFTKSIHATGAGKLPYTNLRSVIREVVYAEKECRKRGYPILDITGQTVEETAALILQELHLERKDLQYC